MLLFWAIVKLSVKNLWAHKLRSFLTVLGIMIGVSSVIAMLALGTGAKEGMIEQIRSFGANTLVLIPGFREDRGAATADFQKLTIQDAQALLDEVPELHSVSPGVQKMCLVKRGNRNVRVEAQGVASTFVPMRNYQLEQGRLFSAAEENNQKKVAIVGYKIIAELFDGKPESALGESVKIDGGSYRIIGTLRERGNQGFSQPDNVILVPYTTGMRRLMGKTDIEIIHIKVSEEDKIDSAIKGITRVMRKRHRLTSEKDDDFRVFSSKDALQSLEAIGAIFTLLLSGIASVSLLVGGIGIMNIMLVTVTERTREIGIRKALGAKRRDILRQFLIESIVISLIGGSMGVIIGIGMTQLANMFDIVASKVSLSAIGLSLGFCVFIGVFFGIYPARKASKLDPIEALRYE